MFYGNILLKMKIQAVILSLVLLNACFRSQQDLNRAELSNIYGDFTSATEMNFTDKSISSIDGSTFNCLFNLTTLLFNSNELTKIEPLTFKDLLNLETLDFSFNNLASIHPL
jgi:hypothetical protein